MIIQQRTGSKIDRMKYREIIISTPISSDNKIFPSVVINYIRTSERTRSNRKSRLNNNTMQCSAMQCNAVRLRVIAYAT